MSENETQKVPTRPGSKWATGRRLRMTAPKEREGFAFGARVTRKAPTQKPARTRHRSRK